MMRTFSPTWALTHMAHDWWLLTLRGLAAVYFATFLFLAPSTVLDVLLLLLGGIIFIDGLLNLSLSLHWRTAVRRWWLFLLQGVLGIILGVIVVFDTTVSFNQLLALLVIWAVITGGLELSLGISLRADSEIAMLLLTSGCLTLVFGLMLYTWTDTLESALQWITAYAFIYGVLTLAVGLELRRHERKSRA